MSFNRLKYDNSQIVQYNKETTGPGNYLYDTPIMCNTCLNDNPWVINQKNGASLNKNVDWRFYNGPVDIESNLFNLKGQNVKVPLKEETLVNSPKCFFPTEDTRLSNPCTNLRGTGWNRFDPICKNPQDQVTFPGEYMTSTRIVFKDNHRPSVVSPKVNNMNPNETLEKCPMTNSVCGNYVKPLYQYDVCG